MGDLSKHMIFGFNGGFSKRKCLVFWLQQKTRDFRLNVGFEKTRDFRLNGGFEKRKRVIFRLNGGFLKRKRVIFALMADL